MLCANNIRLNNWYCIYGCICCKNLNSNWLKLSKGYRILELIMKNHLLPHTCTPPELTAGHNKLNLLLSFFRLFFQSIVFHQAHRSCETCLDVLADLRNRKPGILVLLNDPNASWQNFTCARNTQNPLNYSITWERTWNFQTCTASERKT